MDFAKLKKAAQKEMHPAWVWVLAVTMGLFSFISYNYLFEPSYMPAPFVDFSKRVVNEVILGDKDWRKTEEGSNLVNNDSSSQTNNTEKNNDFADIDTSTWKTYENKEHGFSVKYPEDWQKREGKDIFVEKGNEDVEGEIKFVSVNIYSKNDLAELNDWIDINKNLFIGDQNINEVKSFSERKKVEVNGLQGLQFSWESMGEIKATVFGKNNKVYVVLGATLSSFSLDKDFSYIYNKMVDSFDV